MGVSYFSCDKCGTVLNDHAGGYVRLNYEVSKGTWEDGTYCDSCADEIKSERYPSDPMDILIIRKVKPEDDSKSYQCYTLTEISRDFLKSMISCIKNDFEVAIYYDVDFKKNFADGRYEVEELTFEEICEKLNTKCNDVVFQKPEEMFNEMCKMLCYANEKDPYNWGFFPGWPNQSQKRIRLEDKITQLNKEIQEKQTELNRKKLKLTTLPSK